MQQHGDADADRLPVHPRHQRLPERRQGVQKPHHRVLAAELRPVQKIIEVVSRTERGPFAREQHYPHRLVRLRPGEAAIERLVHGVGDGVALLGTIEAHIPDAIGA